jgi:hypothetical protein
VWKPCDVGEGFKTIKGACKKAILAIDDAALNESVKQRPKFRNQG